ncbi:MAG TPA: hypothetical protein VMD02_03295 [Candidatus Omnitrophota bacterium]|nr:hypothetical protein [Candidatus Omnitrophota bacterium]
MRNAILIVVILASAAFASSSSVDPMSLGVGARSIAMGRTNIAAPGDINAIFVNPANAAYIANWGATSMYTSLLEGELNYTMLGGAAQYKGAGAGICYLGGGATGLQTTTRDASGRVAAGGDSFDYSNSTITAAMGKEFNDKLAAGGSIKMFSKSFSGQSSGSGFSADLGMLYKLNSALTLGLAAQNVLPTGISWGTGVNEPVAMNIKGGLNYLLPNNLLVNADLDLMPFAAHAGVEWKPMPMLALRGGLENIPTGSSSSVMDMMAGIGLNFNGIGFDYAYFNDGSLAANNTHFFTLSFVPPAPRPAATAAPAAPSAPSVAAPKTPAAPAVQPKAAPVKTPAKAVTKPKKK